MVRENERLIGYARVSTNELEDLKERGIGFRSISDGMIDTTSTSGELMLNIFSALAQFERRLIQEGGRPPIGRDHPRILLANKLFLF